MVFGRRLAPPARRTTDTAGENRHVVKRPAGVQDGGAISYRRASCRRQPSALAMLIQRRNLFGVFRSVWCTSRPTLTTKHIAPGVRRGAQQTPDRHLSQAGLTPSLRLGRVPLALRADCGGVSAVSAVMQERGTFTATQCGHRCQVLVLAGPEFSKGTVAADLLPQYLSAIGCRHTDSCPDLLCAVAFWLRLRSLLRLLPGACERMSMWRLPWEKSGFSTSRLRTILSDTCTRTTSTSRPEVDVALHSRWAGV